MITRAATYLSVIHTLLLIMSRLSPMERTENENIAVILQKLLKETRELKEDNRKLREEVKEIRNAPANVEEEREKERTQRRRRKTAPKECQVSFSDV